MSAHFVILVSSGTEATDLPAPWQTALERAGLQPAMEAGPIHAFLRAGNAALVMPGRGVIVGMLFARSDGRPFDGPGIGPLLRGADVAPWLIRYGWGRYVAALFDPERGAVDIVRDPAGLVPCYEARVEGWTAFASDARLLLELGLISGRLDWAAVARSLIHPELRTRETPLLGVTEPIPGEHIRITGGLHKATPCWLPRRFVDPVPPLDFEVATQRLQHEIERCMASWCGRFDRLLLSLSGGLDSSILAATVPEPGRKLAAVTLVSGSGRGDETPYAQALATHFGFPLLPRKIRADAIDLTRSLSADQPRPTARAFTQVVDRVLAVAADDEGAHAHINGGGGDSVLGYLHSANPAADRLRIEGPGSDFVRTLLDLSRITQCTVWHVGRRAIAKAWFTKKTGGWPSDLRFVAPEILETLAPGPTHPWLDGLEDLLPGQREHIISILRAMSTVDALNIEDGRPTLYPMFSQPVVELCLGMPTWLHCQGGRDRAVARAAFGSRLPGSVAGRRIKGSFDGLTMALFEAHLPEIRERLLDGRLAQHGLLARDQLEEALGRSVLTGEHHGRLLQLVDVEAWAAAWGEPAASDRTGAGGPAAGLSQVSNQANARS